MSLDDLMLISDNRIHMSIGPDADGNLGETTFTELANNVKLPLNDPKLEKKVTFARLMSKVSAEMSSGSEVDAEIVIFPYSIIVIIEIFRNMFLFFIRLSLCVHHLLSLYLLLVKKIIFLILITCILSC